MTAAMLREGEQFAMPAQWRELRVEEQTDRLVSAEARRVSNAWLFALAAPVLEAVRAVIDQPVALLLLPTVLPALSGMIVFARARQTRPTPCRGPPGRRRGVRSGPSREVEDSIAVRVVGVGDSVSGQSQFVVGVEDGDEFGRGPPPHVARP